MNGNANKTPCIVDDAGAFVCLETGGVARVCVGTYTDDNGNGSYNHADSQHPEERNSYVCVDDEGTERGIGT